MHRVGHYLLLLSIIFSGSHCLLAQAPVPSPSSIALTLDSGTQETRTITVSNSGPAVSFGLMISSPGGAWLSASPFVGTLPANGSVTLTVSIKATTMPPGVYAGKITINASGRPSAVIPVDLTVRGLNVTLTPLSNRFSLRQDEIGSATITVQSAETGDVTATASASVPWITFPVGQTVIPSNSSGNLSIRVDPDSLAPGIYNANVTVTATKGTGPSTSLTSGVVLTVYSRDEILANVGSLSFSGTPLTPGSSPASITVTLTNEGESVSYYLFPTNPWVQLSKTSGTIPARGTDTFSISATAASLAAGVYTGSISVSGNGRAPVILPVTFTVSSSTTNLTVSSSSLAYTATEGQSAATPVSSNVTVTNQGPGVAYTVTADKSWITLNKTGGDLAQNGTDSFSVSANPSGQTAGTKTGTITVSAPGRPSRTIAVTFTVTAAPTDLTVSTNALSFSGVEGTSASTPASSSVTVTNVGPAVSYTLVANQPWLVLSKTAGSLTQNGTDTFTVSANPSAQTTGTKTGTITVSAPGRPSRTITVTFTVTAAPTDLTVSTNALSFSGVEGTSASTPASSSVTVTNVGPAVSYTLVANQPWLVLSKTSGSLAQNGTDSFSVSANPSGQTAGTKTGTITVSAPGRPSRTITVTFTVNAAPTDLTVSTNALSFSGVEGTSASTPASSSVTVTNVGPAVSYTLAANQTWLVLSKTSGSLTQNGTDTFTVSANPSAQTAGTKTGTITVSAPGRPSRTITVTFTVNAAPTDLTVSTNALSFSGVEGTSASTPASSSVTVTNVGPAVSYTLAANQTWLVLSKTAGSLTQNGTDTFTVSANPSAQTAGTKTGTVTVSAPGRPTRTITVTFTVTAAPTDLTVSTNALTFSGVEGQSTSTPASSSVTVTNVGPAVSYTLAANQTWLVLSKTAGSLTQNGTDTFTVSANPSAQTAGTKTGTVTVSAPGRPTRTITVTFTVTAAPTDLTVSTNALSFSGVEGTSASTPASSSVTVTNVGPAVSYTLVANQTWLVLNKTNGSLTQNGTDTFTVSANPSAQTAGTKTGTITVSAPGRPSRTIAVTFTVTAAPTDLTVSTASLAFSGVEGQSTSSPASSSVTVTNVGPAVSYTLAANQTWLVLNKMSGSLTQNGTDTFTVSANPSAQTVGTKTGTVTVSAPGRPTRTITVTFTVTAAPTDLTVSTNALSFSGVEGTSASTPASSSVTLTNVGPAVSYTIIGDQPWLGISKQGGNLAQNGTDTFTVSANPSGLTAGTKTATILVTAPGRPTRSITVTLTVTAAPTDLTVSTSSLSFSGVEGQQEATPASAPVTVSNTGPAVGYSISADQPWIVVDKSGGALPQDGSDTFSVSVNMAGLGAGSLAGSIVVSAPGRPARTILVQLELQPQIPTDMTLSVTEMRIFVPVGTVPAEREVTVSNVGPGVGYLIGSRSPWMRLSKNVGAVPENGQDSFGIQVDMTGKTPGGYYGVVVVAAPGRPIRTVEVVVVHYNPAAKTIQAFPPSLEFINAPGGQPAPQPLRLGSLADPEQKVEVILRADAGGVRAGHAEMALPGSVNVEADSPSAEEAETRTVLRVIPKDAEFAELEVPVTVRAPGHPGYSFPRIADGGGYRTSMVLTNRDDAPAEVTLDAFRAREDGSTEGWDLQFALQPKIIIPPGGTIRLQSPGLLERPETGWIRVRSDRRISGFALIRHEGAGAASFETTVPLNAGWQQRVLLPIDNRGGGQTVLALTNTSSRESGVVSALFRGADGELLAEVVEIRIPALGHSTIRIAEEMRRLANRQGTVELSMQGGRLSVAGFQSSTQGATLVEPLSLNEAVESAAILPQVAAGSQWKTSIIVVNRGALPAPVALRFHRSNPDDAQTADWQPGLSSGQPPEGSETAFTVAPGSSATWDVITENEDAEGWVEILSGEKVDAFATLERHNQFGQIQRLVTRGQSGLGGYLYFPFVHMGARTLVSVVNADSEAAGEFQLTFRGEDGAEAGQATLVLAPGGKMSFDLEEKFPVLSGMSGVVEVAASSGKPVIQALQDDWGSLSPLITVCERK